MNRRDDHPAVPDSYAIRQQVRVLALSREHWLLLLRGKARISNLPGDASIVAALPMAGGIGFHVHSASYAPVRQGGPVPTVTAVVECSRE